MKYVHLVFVISVLLNSIAAVQAQSITTKPIATQSRRTTAEFLSDAIKKIESSCQTRAKPLADEIKMLLAQGKTVKADYLKESGKMLCVCSIQKYKALQSSLSKAELAETMSASQEMQKIFLPVTGGCMRPRAMQEFFGTEVCSPEVIKSKETTAACDCLAKEIGQFLNELSDSELAQLTIDAAQDYPAVVEAKKQGLAEPKLPILLETFHSRLARCKRQ
jgi:redox-regulated HSP33 family molecular chaperone